MIDFKFAQALKVMDERFGCDSLIALATCENSVPSVRTVNSYYEKGCFYIITHAASGKMRAIKNNPQVAVCGDWFTGHGLAENMGHILSFGNLDIADKLRTAFSQWYDNGHINEDDPETVILCIHLTDGILFDHGTRYTINFTK